MDNNMEKKMAVWLKMRGFAETVEQGEEFVRSAQNNETNKELTAVLSKNPDAALNMGGKVTDENAIKFLREKLATGQRLIGFWEENPKDTNAIFFAREMAKIDNA